MNATIEGLLRRRVCRNFADKEIDDGLLNLLLACAQSAPTKSNLQQYSIIAVRDQDTRQKIADLVPSMPWMADAPVFLVFLGDVRRIRRLADSHDHDYANNNADTFMNACVDAALAMQMFIVAAESAGLGCCPISYVRNRIDDFAELLSLAVTVYSPLPTSLLAGRRHRAMSPCGYRKMSWFTASAMTTPIWSRT